jgi:hypothetical protein
LRNTTVQVHFGLEDTNEWHFRLFVDKHFRVLAAFFDKNNVGRLSQLWVIKQYFVENFERI